MRVFRKKLIYLAKFLDSCYNGDNEIGRSLGSGALEVYRMDFSVNHPILYVLVGSIIALVVAQSVFFLVRAVRRAKELGIAKATVKKTISSAAVFTIAPAVAVLVGVVALSKSLGVALPWLRL